MDQAGVALYLSLIHICTKLELGVAIKCRSLSQPMAGRIWSSTKQSLVFGF